MNAITQYLKSRGYDTLDDSFYSYIRLWEQWYRGKVRKFHSYRQYNGMKYINRERKSLGMAKTLAEDWANLELNEKVSIVIDNENIQTEIQQVLQQNQFRVRSNQLIELAYATGTGAFIEYLDGNTVKIDYIQANMIYPLSWDNGRIKECAFASERVIAKEKRIYLNIHRLEHGKYIIENLMFKRQGEMLTQIDLPEDVEPVVQTGSTVPFFQIIRPNIVNNINVDSPMGISVYANAIDQLEGLDLIYDSYINEFRLGKKRITIPMSMARMMQQEDGTIQAVFDDNDTEFYAVPDVESENKIGEINMELRFEAHESAIKSALSLLSKKCGLGNDRYNFNRDSVKTATEIISEKSDLFQNLKKHELILETALTEMVYAIAQLLHTTLNFHVTINFDDSIIQDTNAIKQQFLQEIREGIRQKYEYRMEFLGEDEKTARSMIETESLDIFGGA